MHYICHTIFSGIQFYSKIPEHIFYLFMSSYFNYVCMEMDGNVNDKKCIKVDDDNNDYKCRRIRAVPKRIPE